MQATKASKNNTDNKHEEWFSSFVDKINNHINTDKKRLETGSASKETVAFYKSLVDGDNIKAMSLARTSVSSALIKEVIVSYLNILSERNIPLSKLALDITVNKILVWAEIKENDENSEMDLIRAESMINGQYSNETGISLDSIIVEDTDKLPVPSHYIPLAIS